MMDHDLSHDFDRIEVGTSFRSRGRTITETDLVSFATLTGDFHPVHTDAEWAAESVFGSRIAHGSLVLSYSVGLVPFDPDYIVALGGFERVSFKRPVRIGDTIHVEGVVRAKRELDSATGLVDFTWKVRNQRSEAVVLAKARAVWRREVDLAAAAEARQEVYL